jgi:hypothetical protein
VKNTDNDLIDKHGNPFLTTWENLKQVLCRWIIHVEENGARILRTSLSFIHSPLNFHNFYLHSQFEKVTKTCENYFPTDFWSVKMDREFWVKFIIQKFEFIFLRVPDFDLDPKNNNLFINSNHPPQSSRDFNFSIQSSAISFLIFH